MSQSPIFIEHVILLFIRMRFKNWWKLLYFTTIQTRAFDSWKVSARFYPICSIQIGLIFSEISSFEFVNATAQCCWNSSWYPEEFFFTFPANDLKLHSCVKSTSHMWSYLFRMHWFEPIFTVPYAIIEFTNRTTPIFIWNRFYWRTFSKIVSFDPSHQN